MRWGRNSSLPAGLPLSSAALSALVFTIVWAFLGLLVAATGPGHPPSEAPRLGLLGAVCSGLMLALLIANTVAEMARGGQQRRQRIILNVIAAGLQALILAGSLSMRTVSLASGG